MIKAIRNWAAAALLMASACVSAPTAPAFAPALFVAHDADSTIYLYGTIHLRRPGGDWGGDNVRAALASSETLWTELALGPETDAQTQQLVFAHGFSPEQPLSARLTPEEYARLTEVAQGLGVPVANISAMRPWLASLTLAMLPMLQAGYDPAAGIDEAVNAAAGDGLRRRAFETAEQQIGFFANLSEAAQLQFLRDAIEEAAKGADALDEMSLAWERGDLREIERLNEEFKAEAPEAYDVIFTQRNLAWTDVLIAELEGSGVDFVAVGAGHMVGEDGLVALLRARGVQVERLR